MLSIGTSAPVFSLLDQQGRSVELSGLLIKTLVLYFYPKDFTPGCTAQACAFGESSDAISKLRAHVVGISGDDPKSHEGFIGKHNLPFRLLTDPQGRVAARYDVGKTLGIFPNRVTYIIDTSGVIQLAYQSQLSPRSHVEVVMERLEELANA